MKFEKGVKELMKQNEKIVQKVVGTYSLWVSNNANYVAFKKVPAYKEVKVNSNKELWELVHTLLASGYRVQ